MRQKPAAQTGANTTTGSGKVVETRAQLEERAKSGDAGAEFELGAVYHDGEGGTKDLKLAREWFAKAAAQGEERAQFNLGVMYYMGEGAEKDFAKANEWFTKSANAGNARAQFNLGVMYYHGEGMKLSLIHI